nr:PREDICTED: uncharacterized protein LOC107079342 isoform X2 [Lepisosteus oculatus]
MEKEYKGKAQTSKNMAGVYIGMEGIPPRVKHPATSPHRIYRRSRWSVKTQTECQCYNKIELLRNKEPQQGFTGAVLKPKVKSVIGEEELPPFSLTKKALPTTEELRKLTRKILREYALPSGKELSFQERVVKWCALQGCSRKFRAKDPSLKSSTTKAGGLDTVVLKTMPTKLREQVICNETLCKAQQKQSHGSHHVLSIQNLQIHPEPKRLGQSVGFETSCWLTSANNQFLLPSVSVGIMPTFLPRAAVSMERGRLAGRQGNKKPVAVSSVPVSLVSTSLELKRRSNGYESLRQVCEDNTTNENRNTRTLPTRARCKDVMKCKGGPIQEQSISWPDTPRYSETVGNTQEEKDLQNNELGSVQDTGGFSNDVSSLELAGDKIQTATLNGQSCLTKQIAVIIDLKTVEESIHSDFSNED